MKSLLAICCLVLLTATAAANADIRAPKAPDKPVKYALHTSLEIVPDPKATEATLQIPESDVKIIRAALDAAAGNPPVAAAITHSATRTIIAGLLMFLSVSIAGILFARSSSFGRTQKALAAVMLVVAVIGAAAIITRGNAGPPGSYRWRNLPQALAEGRATAGGVDVEIVPDDPQAGGRIRLILPVQKTKQRGEE